MIKMHLNGPWQMKRVDWYQWIKAEVPGSVYNDLLQEDLMEDPFYGENDKDITALSQYDYVYHKDFTVSEDMFHADQVCLTCLGLDTIATISLNGKVIAKTNNMHRTYDVDVKPFLREGENNLSIHFSSSLTYIEEQNKKYPLWGVDTTLSGYPHLRKAHHMFGWDWGPQLPDAGIWRGISLCGYHMGRIDDVHIRQQHNNHTVLLEINSQVTSYETRKNIHLEVVIKDPNGMEIDKKTIPANNVAVTHTVIENPEIWWPNGFGDHPLYTVQIHLKHNDKVIDSVTKGIGLRTITVKREADQWGESFEFVVNGVPIFIKGADYIPEDSLLARVDDTKTEQLIRDCVDSHFNCIRVWGGGIYPEDSFFDLCDRYGLIVWQDFMFACAVYKMTEAFTENIVKEFEDNIKRIRHHACLGMWCGNNEMEWAWEEWNVPDNKKLRMDYLIQFEKVIPDVLAKHDPDTYYWPCSPSSGGGFMAPNDPNKGDTHFWNVFHGKEPYEAYRKHHFRFISEFGLQAFPSLKTVESYTKPEDRNIFSPVMENHNKCNHPENGNVTIMYYLSMYLKFPKDFESAIYGSQIVQAEAVRCAIEHCRRNRGRCMGTVYWQLNDCYPVASWSSIDYYGRWKALHYFAKRFYGNELLSAEDDGTRINLCMVNDGLEAFSGVVSWKLMHQDTGVIKKGNMEISTEPLSSQIVAAMDFTNELSTKALRRNTYFVYELREKGKMVSSETHLFVRTKAFEFQDPKITTDIIEKEDVFLIRLMSQAFGKYVTLTLEEVDATFDDNYISLIPNEEKVIELKKARLSEPLSLSDLKKQLHIRSIFDLSTY
ncbi:glycoside hydrolase family 2 protein [Vallitalea pronyensis]|uniref:Beta-mannosidase B n=1 Tax=Vallitalea pronyensis TaxID=1348613 RepID=A0A8J8MMV5_9FIRM|nr:glycoside hydrolase family 2 protein [Vallitalea pronyensis]QUI24168.1 glycoside hydrolase family 2 protein [Vallitalea pronyensis]